MPSPARCAKCCAVLLLLTSSTLSWAQSVAGLTYELVQGVGKVTVVGTGFSAGDEVVVAGISLEIQSLSDSRIEALLPASVKLVGGSYVVRVIGKQKISGTLIVK